ncbi:MAG TPA: HAMP domain-containing sensor histidine kinase [Mycobacteriales bacterium]|nr:HAMP domain-containing sensor histidine kinase [Mycobacteriales bacterium]
MRSRIQWVGALAAALAIGLFGVPLAVSVVVLFRADERGELDRVADTTAVRVAPVLAAGRPLTELPRAEEDMHVAVYGLQGQRLLGDGPAVADGPVQQAVGGATAGGSDAGDFVVAIPVTSGSRVVGVVRAASAQSRVWLQVGLTWLAMAGLAAAAIAAAALLARRQSRRLADPLERLATAAQTLGDGDFTVRLAPAGIPEIDAAASALTRTAERLGDLVGRERAFSADASHQLRTPLTGLRLRLETALDGDADLRGAVEGALTTADRLERTIDELLALARDAPHARTPADLPAVLAELESSWSGPLAAAGRSLQITLQPELSGTRASAAAVRHILDVLLANAQGHGAGMVSIVVREADTAIALDVTDEGPGVAEPEELFRRRTSRGAGHGIGLALARALAEAEGGRLLLSRPGPGPVFTLLLPAEIRSTAVAHPSGQPPGLPSPD